MSSRKKVDTSISAWKGLATAEKNFIRDNYEKLTIAQLCKNLKRGQSTILSWMKSEGIAKSIYHPLTDNEKRFICDNYHSLSIRDLCKAMNRGAEIIRKFITENGFSKTNKEPRIYPTNSDIWKDLNLTNILYHDNNGNLCEEIWLPVVGFEGLYEISNIGRVKSVPKTTAHRTFEGRVRVGKPIIKRQRLTKFGYLNLLLWKDGAYTHFMVHVLVARHFIPNPENKTEVNHLAGIKEDNRHFKLEWATRSENIKHAFRIGLINQDGENHPSNKLNNKKVLEIFKSNLPQTKLANKYGVCVQTIANVQKGNNWSHITGKINPNKKKQNDRKSSYSTSTIEG